jgi:hypothetical protein
MSRSVRTCLVCRKRRHLPAFVGVNFSEQTLHPICEGCLDAPDSHRRVGAYLRHLEDQRFWMYYVLGQGSKAADLIAPRMDDEDHERIIARDFTGLTNVRDFWDRVYSGPAPAQYSIGTGSRVIWSEMVWRGSPPPEATR